MKTYMRCLLALPALLLWQPSAAYAECSLQAAGEVAETIISAGKFEAIKGPGGSPTDFLKAWGNAGYDPEFWESMDPFEYIQIKVGKDKNGEDIFRSVHAGEFLANIKKATDCFSKDYGLDIFSGVKMPEQFAEWKYTVEEKAQMLKEAKQIYDSIKNFDPKRSAREFGESYVKDQLEKAIADDKNPTLAALYKDVQEFKQQINDWDEIPVPGIPFRDDLDSITDKRWKASFGNKDTVKAEIGASFHVQAKGSEAQVVAEANGFVQFFGSKEFKYLTGNFTVDVNNTKGFSTQRQLWVLGSKLADEKETGGGLWKYEGGGDPIPLIDVAQKFRFFIGPIPCSGKVGANGSTRFKYHLGVAGLTASASLGPAITGKAYAEFAVDVYVAAVGAGAELVIIDADANLRAWAAVNFDAQGKPYVTNGIDAKTHLTLLSGYVYGFAELTLPSPLNQKFVEYLYKHNGIRKEMKGLAINFEKKVSQGQISVAGGAEQVDLTAINLDQKKMDVLQAIDDEMRTTPGKIGSAELLNTETRKTNDSLNTLEQRVFGPISTFMDTW